MSQQGDSSSGSFAAGASTANYTKYASLPDVDTSAPDVYEYEGPTRAPGATRAGRQRSRKQDSVDDSDDSDTSGDDSDRSASHRKHPGDGKGAPTLNDDIDSSSLRRNDAAAKFNGATDVDTSATDFSGRLRTRRVRKTNTMATRPRDAGLETSTYVLDSEARGAEPESVVDRLRRLKFEASQLEEELSASTAGISANQGAAAKAGGAADEVDSAKVLAQLKVLQDQLAKLPSDALSPTSATVSTTTVDKEAVRTLLQQVKQSPAPISQGADGSSDAAVTSATASEARAPDMVQLEARLSELESTLGVQQALLDESKPVPRPVLSTLSRLEHQLSVLTQPRHLDAISRRVKVLVTEMDRVHEVRRRLTTEPTTSSSDPSQSSTLTPTEVTKLQHLFDVSTRLEPLLPLLPSVLTRLQTLSELHASAAHFGSVLDELEEGRDARQQQQEELQELLGKMEENMEENRKKVEANLESLQVRIENVAERMQKLS